MEHVGLPRRVLRHQEEGHARFEVVSPARRFGAFVLQHAFRLVNRVVVLCQLEGVLLLEVVLDEESKEPQLKILHVILAQVLAIHLLRRDIRTHPVLLREGQPSYGVGVFRVWGVGCAACRAQGEGCTMQGVGAGCEVTGCTPLPDLLEDEVDLLPLAQSPESLHVHVQHARARTLDVTVRLFDARQLARQHRPIYTVEHSGTQ
mmetsp:Transcript_57613/g.158648  ORF Transcript_57613/g.158648 Transcript_57613/m.158648 type:complete len:204 (+) Transcript_57613:803-1414(+)